MLLQGMDTHSNILYVQENFPALSHLAHRTAATDKYRPETCCIIGNYYSLKAQHEKVGPSLVIYNCHSNTCAHVHPGAKDTSMVGLVGWPSTRHQGVVKATKYTQNHSEWLHALLFATFVCQMTI